MKFAHIVAVSRNSAIGRQGGLPWHLSADLKYFKATTMGACIVMGRRTFESIGRPLPGRHTIVLTRQSEWSHPGVTVVNNPQLLPEACATTPDGIQKEYAFIIGGGDIYQQTLAIVDTVYRTLIDLEVNDADTYYPRIEELGFELIEETKGQENGVGYAFQLLRRTKSQL